MATALVDYRPVSVLSFVLSTEHSWRQFVHRKFCLYSFRVTDMTCGTSTTMDATSRLPSFACR